MEQCVKDEFTPKILEEACSVFGIKPSDTNFIGEVENFVYSFSKSGKTYFLRITHDSHRSEDELMAELEFIRQLNQYKIRAVSPLLNKKGKYLHKVTASNSDFFVCSFEEAIGNRPAKDLFNPPSPKLFNKWGAFTGQCHKAAQAFEKQLKRKHWKEDDLLNVEKYIPNDIDDIKPILKNTIKKIWDLPEESNSFGIIHSDIHQGNYYIDDQFNLSVFDWDDSSYNFFIADWMIPIYYTIWSLKPRSAPQEWANIILENFRQGYETYYHLNDVWIKRLPDFLKLREACLFIFMNKKWSPEEFKKMEPGVYEHYLERIRSEEPFLNLEF